MRPGEGNIINQNNIGGVVSNAKLHDIVPAVRLLEYQRLMLQFSESILLSMPKSVPHSNHVLSREEDHASKIFTIDALKNLQAIVTADLHALQREERFVSDSFIDANNLQRATVNKNASPLADLLPNAFQVAAYSRKKTPYFAIEDSGVPILESPVYVPSPVIESTPRNEANPAGPAQSDASSEPLLLSSEFHGDELFDTGTQCSSNDLQSVSEASDDVSEYKDSDDSDYVDDASRKAKRKAAVKLKVIPETVEPAPSTTTSSEQRSKRVCHAPERLDLKNVKSIKEERVFQRVQKDGAPVREETAALKTLQQWYGKGWMRRPGFKIHGYGDVVINPGGVEYKLEEKPVLGKDFFATAHDALAYCEANGIPRIQLPMAIDPAVDYLAIDNGEVKADRSDDGGDSGVNSDVTVISSFEGCY